MFDGKHSLFYTFQHPSESFYTVGSIGAQKRLTS